MDSHHLCHSELMLGLGLGLGHLKTTTTTTTTTVDSCSPSLTLRLPGQPSDLALLHDLYGQDSSSLSNASFVKRERETAGEEVEIERPPVLSSRLIDEYDDGSNGRKKLRLTKAQSALLEQSFKHHTTLNPKKKLELARDLKLRPRQVEVWFQNRRARNKLKQTEIDCEFMKRWCESLTDENRRLRKEVQELKSLKVTHPLYMQLPAATLTMCPSCERICGADDGASENASQSAFAPPRHVFSNPSAAC